MEAIPRLKSNLHLQVAALVGIACIPVVALGAAPPSPEEIAAELTRVRSAVESLAFTADRLEPADGADGAMKRVGHETFGFKGEKRFIDWSLSRPGHMTRSGGDGEEAVTLETGRGAEAALFDRSGNVLHRERRAFDGSEFRCQSGANLGEIHSTATKDILHGSRFDSFYLRCIGWFVPDPMGPTDFEKVRQVRFVPQAFDHGDYVASEETVDGQRCVKLAGTLRTEFAPGNTIVEQDELWLAPDLGYMLVRRRVRDEAGQRFEVHGSKPVEVVPGCWIPQECRVLEENTGAPAKTTVLRITSWSSDDLEDGRFRLEFPEGAMVADFATTAQRGLPLAQPVVLYVADTGDFLDRPLYQIKAERARLRLIVYIAAGIVVAVGLFWQWRRFARRRSGPTPVPTPPSRA